MRNKVNSTTARLAAVLLTLVMIAGSFSAFVFADVSADEDKLSAKEQQTENIEQTSNDGNETASDEEQSASDVQPESPAEVPEATAEKPETATEESGITAEEPEPALSGAVSSEAKNEEDPEKVLDKVTVSYNQVPNGKISAKLKTNEKEISIESGDTIDLPGGKDDRLIFTGEPDAGYIIKQFTITNGTETTVFPGDWIERMGTNSLVVKLEGIKGNITFAAEFEVKKYKVDVYSDDDGSVTVDKTEAAEGDTVTVKAVPASGYRTKYVAYAYEDDQWSDYIYLNGDPATGIYSFSMPARDVTIIGSFFKPVIVNVKESKGGTVTLTDRATGKEIKNGDEVEPFLPIVVSAKAKSGYSFSKWEFTAADGSSVSFFKKGSYFRMPNSDATVEAVFTKTSSSGSGSSSSSTSSSSGGSSGTNSENAEEPATQEAASEEPSAEELTEEEQMQLDVTPIVSRVVAETVLGANVSLVRLMSEM